MNKDKNGDVAAADDDDGEFECDWKSFECNDLTNKKVAKTIRLMTKYTYRNFFFLEHLYIGHPT